MQCEHSFVGQSHHSSEAHTQPSARSSMVQWIVTCSPQDTIGEISEECRKREECHRFRKPNRCSEKPAQSSNGDESTKDQRNHHEPTGHRTEAIHVPIETQNLVKIVEKSLSSHHIATATNVTSSVGSPSPPRHRRAPTACVPSSTRQDRHTGALLAASFGEGQTAKSGTAHVLTERTVQSRFGTVTGSARAGAGGSVHPRSPRWQAQTALALSGRHRRS